MLQNVLYFSFLNPVNTIKFIEFIISMIDIFSCYFIQNEVAHFVILEQPHHDKLLHCTYEILILRAGFSMASSFLGSVNCKIPFL